MALSLNTETFGDLIDPFDGVKDLEKGIIRTPLDPDVTYSDDHLRMLRAIRFAPQLNFKNGNKKFRIYSQTIRSLEDHFSGMNQ